MIKVTKRKTNNPYVWKLYINGVLSGVAEANYKTNTQRSWSLRVNIDGKVYNCDSAFSIKQGIKNIESQLFKRQAL